MVIANVLDARLVADRVVEMHGAAARYQENAAHAPGFL